MRIYLDNCCFNRPFDDKSLLSVRMEAEAKLQIQEDIRRGRHELVWSYMNEYENDANPYDERQAAIIAWRKFSVKIIGPDAVILTAAKKLEAFNIKLKDALHLSCAKTAGCSHFLTTDIRLLKKDAMLPEIKIINPIDFIREQEEKHDADDSV